MELMIPIQPLHEERQALVKSSNKLTVKQLWKGLRPSSKPVRFQVSYLFNPLLELEQLQEETTDSSSSSDDDKAVTTSCHRRQIELSSFSYLEGLVQEECKDLSSSKKKRVHFSENRLNIIHWIPSHRDYCREEYNSIWANPDEIAYHATRNRIEFAFEGSDWRSVLDETQFIQCSDGQLYHPITVQLNLERLRQEEFRLLAEEAMRLATRKRKDTHSIESILIAKRSKLSLLAVAQ